MFWDDIKEAQEAVIKLMSYVSGFINSVDSNVIRVLSNEERADSELNPVERKRIAEIDVALGVYSPLVNVPEPTMKAIAQAMIQALSTERMLIKYSRPGPLPSAFISIGSLTDNIRAVELPKIDRTLDKLPETVQDINNILGQLNLVTQPKIDSILTNADAILDDFHRLGQPQVKGILLDINQILYQFNQCQQPRIDDILDSVDDSMDEAAQVLRNVNSLFVTRTLEPVDVGKLSPGIRDRMDYLSGQHSAIEQKIRLQRETIGKMGVGEGVEKPVAPVIRDGGIVSSPPVGDRNVEKALLRYQEWERLKIGKELDGIRFSPVDRPGVIPNILQEVHGILGKINVGLGKALGFADKYALLIKIGLGISGIAAVLTLVLIPVLVVRMILYGL